MGRAHAYTRVPILAQDLNIRIVTAGCEFLRELILDPARDYQPLAE